MKKNDFRDATIYAIVAGYLENLNNISPIDLSISQPQKRTIQRSNAGSIAEGRRMQRNRR